MRISLLGTQFIYYKEVEWDILWRVFIQCTLFTFWEICACTKKVINRRDSIDAYLFTKLGRIKIFFIKFTKKKILQNFHYE